MPIGYVYLITNLLNGMKYVGLHTKSEFDPTYYGSGRRITEAVRELGRHNFSVEVLSWHDSIEELQSAELRELVSRDAANNSEYYNMINTATPCGAGEQNPFYGMKHTSHTKQLLSDMKKGIPISDHHREQLDIWLQSDEARELWDRYSVERSGIPLSEDHKNKIRETCNTEEHKAKLRAVRERYKNDEEWYNRTYDAAFRQNVSDRFKGIPITEEHKANISAALTGVPHPWQDKINKNPEKIRKTAEKNRGSKRSDETRKRISESKKGKPGTVKGKLRIHNPETKEKRFINPGDDIPEGFKRGYGPRK